VVLVTCTSGGVNVKATCEWGSFVPRMPGSSAKVDETPLMVGTSQKGMHKKNQCPLQGTQNRHIDQTRN
jgi:hypothetical protein